MSDPNTEQAASAELEQHDTDAAFAAIVAADAAKVAIRSAQIFAEREEARREKDLALFEIMKSIGPESTKQEVLEAGKRVTELKSDSPLEVERRRYTPGAQFRVAKEGARLEALIFFGDTNWAGWSRNLEVGEIVELVDWREGWNTPGTLIPQFAARTRMPSGDARWVTIAPVAGLFRPYPHPGFLEPLDEGDEA
jgi:hypothetical protein